MLYSFLNIGRDVWNFKRSISLARVLAIKSSSALKAIDITLRVKFPTNSLLLSSRVYDSLFFKP